MSTLSSPGTATAAERKRDSLLLLARMRVEAREPVHEVRVRNLSTGGMMAECEPAFAADTPVSLEMRGIGAVTGRVAWCEGGRIGIAFDRPIDPRAARKPVSAGAGGAGAGGAGPGGAPLRAKAPPRR